MDDRFLELLNRGGVLGLLLAIIIAGARRWWVFGWQYEAMRAERDQWKALAMRSRDLARLATDLPSEATWDGLTRTIPS